MLWRSSATIHVHAERLPFTDVFRSATPTARGRACPRLASTRRPKWGRRTWAREWLSWRWRRAAGFEPSFPVARWLGYGKFMVGEVVEGPQLAVVSLLDRSLVAAGLRKSVELPCQSPSHTGLGVVSASVLK